MVVANAVDPIPVVVPEPIGGLIVIHGADKYPDPAFVISIEIVPAAETIAVAEAPTFIFPDVIWRHTQVNWKNWSYLIL